MIIDVKTFNVTKNGGQSILASNFTMKSNNVFYWYEILIETDTAVIFEYTRNGTDWFEMNDSTTLKANNGYLFYLPALQNDAFNIRPKTGTAVIIKGMIRGETE